MDDKSIAHKGFKLKEVEKLLKLCVKLSVSEIKIGEIHVIFDETTPGHRKPRKAVRIAQEKAAQTAELQMQVDSLNDEISVSHLEDPLGFEEALVAGKLREEIHSQ